MDDFSNVYEKLSDMGFSSSDIDSAIEIGLYTFDDIFNALVDKELASSKLQVSNTFTNENSKQNNDKIDNENNCLRTKLSEGDTMTQTDRDIHSLRRSDNTDPPKLEVVTNYSRVISSSITSSVLSNNGTDSGSKTMTKIQVMDLLDPSYQPQTYSQPFLASLCSIRDIICWFCQSRSNNTKDLLVSPLTCKSRVAISIDTNLNSLIGLFEDLKWHLVLPSGANSLRIYGRDNLDKYLDQLGLVPSAHLLAIVGCPLHLRRDSLHKLSSSPPIANNSSIPDTESCHVYIRMINYRNNPLYLHGRSSFKQLYNLDGTTLQNVVSDFSSFCGRDLSSFVFLQMNPSKVFSYPDDYKCSLRELAFVDNVTLYCHSHTPAPDPGSYPFADHRSTAAFTTWETVGEVPEFNNNNEDNQSNSLFPGTGQALPGTVAGRRSVREVWSDRSVSNEPLTIRGKTGPGKQHKSLFRLCLAILYRSLKDYQLSVCRQVRRLPNSLQQILIRELIDDQSLTTINLSHFCTAKSCLVSLDLSYTVQATNEALKIVARCSSLEELILDNEDHVFNNDGLWHLRSCVNLRRLSLNYCARISDWGLQVAAELPRLSVLSVKHTAVTDAGLEHLCASVAPPPLTSLDLSGLPITDRSVPCLAVFQGLQLLSLASTRITVPGSVPRLPELRHLDLSHCPQLVWAHGPGEAGAASSSVLSDRAPSLTSLAIRDLSPADVAPVTRAVALCGHLRQVDGLVAHPAMTAGLLSQVAHLPLDSLVLAHCSHVTDLWLPVIGRLAATLSHLVLSSCPGITGANGSLALNLGRLGHLSWLDLSHLENVTDPQQIIDLVLGPHFPRMQVLWFSLTEDEELSFRARAGHTPFKVNITRSLPRSPRDQTDPDHGDPVVLHLP